MSNRDELANMKEEGLEVNCMEAKTMKDMQK
ncbi:nucleotide pyrophosphohydrolase, partial [Klebsiella pneumoniae]|nr:nucleotide pyrophosphohydrolase [Klebsiella pneumoniae]